jgi:hypothetical protein
MVKIFVFFWCVAGLLTLDVVLRSSSRPARPPWTAGSAAPAAPAAPVDSLPVVQLIRTRCELPAGTVVFVVRGKEAAP